MRTTVVVNDSEQHRVKQVLSLNTMQRAAQSVEMITVNKWATAGRHVAEAARLAAGAFGKGARKSGMVKATLKAAGHHGKAAGKEAWKSKGAKAAAIGGATAGGIKAVGALRKKKEA